MIFNINTVIVQIICKYITEQLFKCKYVWYLHFLVYICDLYVYRPDIIRACSAVYVSPKSEIYENAVIIMTIIVAL